MYATLQHDTQDGRMERSVIEHTSRTQHNIEIQVQLINPDGKGDDGTMRTHVHMLKMRSGYSAMSTNTTCRELDDKRMYADDGLAKNGSKCRFEIDVDSHSRNVCKRKIIDETKTMRNWFGEPSWHNR